MPSVFLHFKQKTRWRVYFEKKTRPHVLILTEIGSSKSATHGMNDYVYFQVRNNSGNQNLTLELNSDWFLEER